SPMALTATVPAPAPAWASAPAPVRLAATLAAVSSLRSTTATDAPAPASAPATTRPSAPPPPVTTATRPDRSNNAGRPGMGPPLLAVLMEYDVRAFLAGGRCVKWVALVIRDRRYPYGQRGRPGCPRSARCLRSAQ